MNPSTLRGLARTRRNLSSSFAELEQSMWQRSAVAYSTTFANVTVQAANALLDGAAVPRTSAAAIRNVMTVAPARFGKHNEAAKPAPRQSMADETVAMLPDPTRVRVLDVATGTGLMAAAAAMRGATDVVGVDTSKAMIDLCKPVADAHPGVLSFVLGDAEKLPVADASFDSVILGFCLLHLPDPSKALKEAFRVLKPGGKIAYSVWQSPDKGNRAFGLILDAITKHGDAAKELPGAPLPFFHFADEANASGALAAAGFAADSIEVLTVPSVAALAHEDDLFTMFASATARTRALLEMQTPEQLEAIRSGMAAEITATYEGAIYQGVRRSTSWLPTVPGTDEPLSDGRPSGRTPWQVPMPCVVASAQKP